MRRLRLIPIAALLLAPGRAHADVGYAVHVEGTAARMVGDRKVDQFGWGGGGLAAPELTLGDRLGLELPLGALALSDGTRDQPGMTPTSGGFGLFALPGVRLRPFGRYAELQPLSLSGLWLAGGAGVAYSGSEARFALDARLGYDLFADASFRGGPSVGYLQIVETSSMALPQDARVVLFGLHGAFEPTPAGASPPSDRDGDGIADDRDGCPDDPEDRDGFEDRDGCPDHDNDQDGIRDADDGCPNLAEDVDHFEDDDGCPDVDNDYDGILDADDACPMEAEDPDGFEDEDGCPESDNDSDGLADGEDKCPDEPETVNGYADDDGCPDDVLARVVGDEILLDERVYFHVNRDDVQVRSWEVLKSVADLLIAHPQYAIVRVQGHADDTGDEAYNKALSERRSRSVRAMLVQYGVEPERLVTEGFGEDRPRLQPDGATNQRTVYARNKNRRVEFLILRRRTLSEARRALIDRNAKDDVKEAP